MADPNREGLRAAARVIFARIKSRAPTEKSAASFTMSQGGSGIEIRSHDDGTVATDGGFRHPLFGNEDRWYGPAGRQVGRKNFVELAALRAIDKAADEYGDKWLQVWTDSTPDWDEG